ncbi:signal peptidase I [Palaeococcus ferrophilus]|uniref:signal peptidase I n=1 Tax=Palaeococcus ferrophilus TaxID=83868 RepID=UPI00064E9E71|nr:signal peptidase I [Palaeococcus ferrophilus]
MDEKMKKELKETVAFFVVALVVVFAFHTGLKFALHTDSPLVIVVSGSMEPVFYRGDVVLLKGVKPEEVEIGDVVVYNRPYTKYPIIHRVRGIEEYNGERCFVIQGDNNFIHDFYPTPAGEIDCVPASAVEAKALMVFPKIGYIPMEIKEKLGMG